MEALNENLWNMQNENTSFQCEDCDCWCEACALCVCDTSCVDNCFSPRHS